MAPVPASQLADHFLTLGCRVEGETDFDVGGLSHVEDGRLSTLAWNRGACEDSSLEVGILVGTFPPFGDSQPLVSANLHVASLNPRRVLRSVILKFFPPEDRAVVAVGRDCEIHPSAVLGANGQGYDWDSDHWESFPHVGGLRIEAGVDVGPCASIMRGSIGDTVIGRGTKIGNGVNIGHDTRIGTNVLVVSGASLAGWVRVGNDAKIWQGAMIKNGVRVGEGAQIAMGAVVLKDIPPHEVWGGNPARKL